MSEDQLSSLIAKLQADDDFRQKLQNCADLDEAVLIAKEAGFEVSKADWVRYQATKTTELSDAELEAAAGGAGWLTQCGGSIPCNCVVSGKW